VPITSAAVVAAAGVAAVIAAAGVAAVVDAAGVAAVVATAGVAAVVAAAGVAAVVDAGVAGADQVIVPGVTGEDGRSGDASCGRRPEKVVVTVAVGRNGVAARPLA
jgi:hypothetical protein